MLEYFPEPEERKVVIECDLCEKPLFAGDTVYKLMDKYICKDCIDFAESEVE
jgi:formylmethanofuran dehydrogenase subunit E